VALSASSLVEIAILTEGPKPRFQSSLREFFDDLSSNPAMQVLPITFDIALEVASLSPLRDPVDRTIVATARVHRMKLVTSDQRIIASGLVPVIE